jgi:hypothetical protein
MKTYLLNDPNTVEPQNPGPNARPDALSKPWRADPHLMSDADSQEAELTLGGSSARFASM